MCFDMRKVWASQTRYVFNIVRDIIRNNASTDVLDYASYYAEIEAPFPINERCDVNHGANYIRVNYGEAYAYIPLNSNNKPKGLQYVYWCNDEMGIEHYTTFYGTLNDLKSMDLNKANETGLLYGYDKSEYENSSNSIGRYIKHEQDRMGETVLFG